MRQTHTKKKTLKYISLQLAGNSAHSKGRLSKKGFLLTKGVPGCSKVDPIQNSTAATQTDAPIANDGNRFLIPRENSVAC